MKLDFSEPGGKPVQTAATIARFNGTLRNAVLESALVPLDPGRETFDRCNGGQTTALFGATAPWVFRLPRSSWVRIHASCQDLACSKYRGNHIAFGSTSLSHFSAPGADCSTELGRGIVESLVRPDVLEGVAEVVEVPLLSAAVGRPGGTA